MGAFEYRQAEEIRDVFARHGVRYLFIGKSGAILLGFPDTTQDADLFVEKSPGNGRAIVAALRELGFDLDDEQAAKALRALVGGTGAEGGESRQAPQLAPPNPNGPPALAGPQRRGPGRPPRKFQEPPG